MGHRANMNNSILAVLNIVKLQNTYNFNVNQINYISEYDFLNVSDYLAEVEDDFIRNNSQLLRDKIFSHLQAVDYIVNTLQVTSSNGIEANMYCTFVEDISTLFSDALIYYSNDNDKLFADLDFLLYDGPNRTDIQGDIVYKINGWELSPEKDTILMQKINNSQKIEICSILDRLKWLFNGLSSYFPDIDPTKVNTIKKITHYTIIATKEEIDKIHKGLVEHKFIPNTVPISHFYYVCNGSSMPAGESPFKPIAWLAGQNDLAYFIEKVFGKSNSNQLWEIATKCFSINKKQPNKNSMCKTISDIRSGYRNKPRYGTLIDNILNL